MSALLSERGFLCLHSNFRWRLKMWSYGGGELVTGRSNKPSKLRWCRLQLLRGGLDAEEYK